MKYDKEWTDKDIKKWRLELIKQRHREIILSKRDGIADTLSDEIAIADIDEPDELESLGISPELEEIDY